ncbi:MAG: TonB-dependent receptor [Prevotellaceae bacterium]|jgi:iron complex outermembrane receptor protein|nr:TonB-dependent receptor [Prevotellaceae bacterium]
MAKIINYFEGTGQLSSARIFFLLLAATLPGVAPLYAAPEAKTITIEGYVVDRTSGEYITGANVVVKSEKSFKAATSGQRGQFSLDVSSLPATLEISFVGYKKQEIDIYELPSEPVAIALVEDYNLLNELVVTARRSKEIVQDIPIPISVVGGAKIDDAGAFNVNRLKELVPTVQLYSSNPRNTGLSIRGLGTTFGLTNDGIDPGVGFYVDGVYFARTASATLDFIDIERIEVLRGPQGTLFGKNTTAGTLNITTRKPQFTPGATFESSFGSYGFIQTKVSLTGPLSKQLAARLSLTGTQRDGLVYNVATQKYTNDQNNLGGKLQLLYAPSGKVDIILSGDVTRQRPDGYAQVVAGVVRTQRADFRQFDQIISDLGYQLPSLNPFDRTIDHDTPWRSGQDLGGVSLNVDVKLGSGILTSTSAWRYWNWDPSNDRDFLGVQGLALSQAPSKQQQWSQEVRWSGELSSRLSGVVGLFAFGQQLNPNPAHTEEAGEFQWRFAQDSQSDLWATPGLFDGYGIKTYPKLNTFSGAVFGQLKWAITDKWTLLPGIRFNYDDKQVDFKRQTYGGLETDNPDLIALKKKVYSDQAFNKREDDFNVSGQLTLSFAPSKRIHIFGTYAESFKPIGLNLGGLPSADGKPMVELAVIKPEEVHHFEVGAKTSPIANSTLNLTVFDTEVDSYQAQVQAAELAVNRGYLANAEKVRVLGVELEGSKSFKYFSLYASIAYTDGKYVSFKNAPLPLEETGLKNSNGESVYFKDISGGRLPGISQWAASFGGEATLPTSFFGKKGEWFFAIDGFYRSSFSSNPSPSKYLVIDAYTLLNARLGFRATEKTALFVWSRNLFDKEYFEQLLPGAGNIGHYAGVLGDPRTFGTTLRYSF